MIRRGSCIWLGNVVLVRAGMATKANRPSHYEALEIDSRSTQAQIKTAYFELSKQYHPDKNSSDEAVQKFRNISEAYEVLSNYETRKIYDRGLTVKNRSRTEHRHSDDPNMKYYQAQAAVFRHSKKRGSDPIYNFDAWTKAHYERTFQRMQDDKAKSKLIRELQKGGIPPRTDTKENLLVIAVSVAFTLTLIFMQARLHSYDKVKDTYVSTKQTGESESVKRESHLPEKTSRQDAVLST